MLITDLCQTCNFLSSNSCFQQVDFFLSTLFFPPTLWPDQTTPDNHLSQTCCYFQRQAPSFSVALYLVASSRGSHSSTSSCQSSTSCSQSSTRSCQSATGFTGCTILAGFSVLSSVASSQQDFLTLWSVKVVLVWHWLTLYRRLGRLGDRGTCLTRSGTRARLATVSTRYGT